MHRARFLQTVQDFEGKPGISRDPLRIAIKENQHLTLAPFDTGVPADSNGMLLNLPKLFFKISYPDLIARHGLLLL